MDNIAEQTDDCGGFDVVAPDGTLIDCVVGSEDKIDASYVVNTINCLYNDSKELELLKTGKAIQIPTSKEHAENMIKLAKVYLEGIN